MRYIEKSTPEPEELLRFRKEGGPNCTYEAFPDKDALRQQLLKDQGYLCCYCMKRVDTNDMKIEHYACQSTHEDQQLDWSNLLGSCRGGEGQRPFQPTCDTCKGAANLNIDPQNKAHIARLKYLADGAIRCDEGKDEIQHDLDTTLNLNDKVLKQNRKHAITSFKMAIQDKFGKKKNWSDARLRKKLASLRTEQRKRHFLGILEYWLEKQIRRRSSRSPAKKRS